MRAKPILIGVAALLLIAGVILLLVQSYLQRGAQQGVADFAQRLPPGLALEYGAVDLGLLGRYLHVNDVRLYVYEQAPVAIERVELLEFDRSGRLPHYLHARLIDVEQDLEPLGARQTELLSRLGYDRIRGDYELDYVYSADDDRLDLRRLGVDLHGICTLSLSLRLGSVDLEQAVTMPQQHLLEAELHGLRLSFGDGSMVSRILRAVAEDQQLTEEQVVQQLLERLDRALAPYQGPFFDQLRQELESFLLAPGQLTLTAQPPRPVPLMDLIAYTMVRAGDVPELLNLSVQAH